MGVCKHPTVQASGRETRFIVGLWAAVSSSVALCANLAGHCELQVLSHRNDGMDGRDDGGRRLVRARVETISKVVTWPKVRGRAEAQVFFVFLP